ncbi:MAG: Gfo/Idh/MocA family oxidoreductase, partial [Planctomycetes bacterium]|nr:Gfo/Idh/MocA family oxidoreductase [Planctomycetota bacterium]
MAKRAKRSKKVRLGLSGCGGMARAHTRALKDVKQAEMVALMDVVPESTEKLAAELVDQGNSRPKLFTDYEKMIDSMDLDGVILVTPHSIHFPQAMYALKKGVHVLVEKPMTTDRTQARKLVAQANKAKRVVSIAFQSTYTPEFQFIRRLREKGELGEVYSFVGSLTQNWLELVRGRWRVEPELSGGGQLYDSGSHMLNAMLYLTDLQPVEVFAFSDYKGMKVDITSALVVKFNNGALASILISGDCPGFANHIELHCSKGVIYTASHGNVLTYYKGRELVRYPRVSDRGSKTPVANFVAAIQGKEEPKCPPIYGVRLAQLMD